MKPQVSEARPGAPTSGQPLVGSRFWAPDFRLWTGAVSLLSGGVPVGIDAIGEEQEQEGRATKGDPLTSHELRTH